MTVADCAVIDIDLYKYTAASAGEKRTVRVTHKIKGGSVEVNNRTEFYGDWRKKDGGLLAQINAKRESPMTWDEFDYEDVQVVDNVENVLHTAKVMVEKDLAACGAKNYIAFLGKGDPFRVEKSTLIKYKDRSDLLKPLLLDKVADYLQIKFDAKIVTGIETDDRVVMECYGDPRKFALIEDKDYFGCPIKVWDRNQQHRGIVDCNKFGRLFLDEKGKVRGEGRIFFYWQVAFGDPTDNYKANCVSDVKFGEKGAYDILVNTTNDKEALQAVVNSYKRLYPEPKLVTGWRGDEFEVDWFYVMEEVFQMARMLRWDDDQVDLRKVLERFKIEC